MRVLLTMILACSWASVAWAKTLRIPRGTIRANRLHDKLLVRVPEWRGSLQPDGTFDNPPLRVEHTDLEIILTFPDDADEAGVRAVAAEADLGS